MGCALYGLHRLREEAAALAKRTGAAALSVAPPTPPAAAAAAPEGASAVKPAAEPILHSPLSAYQGRAYEEDHIEAAIDEYRCAALLKSTLSI